MRTTAAAGHLSSIFIDKTATEEAPVSQRLSWSRPQTDFVIPYLHNLVRILLRGFGRIRFRSFTAERVSWSWRRDKKVQGLIASVVLGARVSCKNAFTNGTVMLC